ncbi:MAG: hypothetical protein GY856_30935 [bacterium]|nr:hypothetical protein [bacterium]
MVKNKVFLLLVVSIIPLSSQARGFEMAGLTATIPVNDYAVHPGMTVEACGGLVGDCRSYTLEGTLRLGVDFPTGAAEIAASDLRLREGDVEFPFPNPEDLPLTDLAGTVGKDQTIRFESPPDSRQQVSWTFLLTENGFVLNGTYDEGCCDRFVYGFMNVAFTALAGTPQETLFLDDGRFAVEVSWRDFHGAAGTGKAMPLTADSGTFWFFAEDNVELVVKVLNACQDPFRHFWFFAAGLTNVEVTITVTDIEADVTRSYTNPLGTSFQPILDTSAFATCEL